MKRKMLNSIITSKEGGRLKSIKKRIMNSKIGVKITALFLSFFTIGYNAYALPEDGAAMTDSLILEALTWSQRLGAILTFFSIIAFALAWKDDDSEAKSRASRFFICSAIVLSAKTILTKLGIV